MRVPFVAGNWKMNGDRQSNARLLDGLMAAADLTQAREVAVCPPYVYLAQVRERLDGSGIGLGAQDVAEAESGAYTGEVAAPMLRDVGCRYVIVGHSERRRRYGDTDSVVAAKTAAALRGGLIPIVCIGELLEERESGRTLAVIERQLEAVFGHEPVTPGPIIAYEPVWAIGTGLTATPDEAEAVHAHVRDWLAARDAAAAAGIRIIYGGSVTAENAASLFMMPNVDGGLIGGASLKPETFITISRAAR